MGQAAERLCRTVGSTGDDMTFEIDNPNSAYEPQEAELAQSSSTKARIISVSTLYVTVELLEPTNLQPGQTVSISHG